MSIYGAVILTESQNLNYKITDGEDKDYTHMTDYYRTRTEAEANCKKGDRIYYSPRRGYCIVRQQGGSPWANIFRL